ncbi:MAG: hypothetical protein AB8G23_02680 [Myxococcota bacterium]
MRIIFSTLMTGIILLTGMASTSTAGSTETSYKNRHRETESVEVRDHFVFGVDERVDGATVLVRDFRNRQIDATITSRALDADTSYSIWWAVFNRPEFCAEPYACQVSDLKGDWRIKPSVFWAGGFISDGEGYGNTAIRLVPGRTRRELFGNTKNYGLQNLKGAEIHVVLRTHGPAGLAGTVAEQVGTATEACPSDGCANVFVSIHSPEE